MQNRIEYLDGQRGMAILMVLLFHSYVRWPAIVPYGDRYADLTITKYGWLGVELFFMISGFVILMTLEKCSGVKDFLYRRWLRLFPGMLLCSLLIFATAGFFPERPAGAPSLLSLLPGLTFIEPAWWSRLTGHPIDSLDGAFWSLYVEFKFYCFAAIVYYWKGRNALIGALLAVFALASLVGTAGQHTGAGPILLLGRTLAHLSFEYFGWFAAGAAFYVYAKSRLIGWFAAAAAMALLSAAATGGLQWQNTLAAVLVALYFAASIVVAPIQALLTWRPLQFFGLISYPLYLLHQNIIVASVVKIGDVVGNSLPAVLFPLLPVAALSATAYVLVKYGEPYVKQQIVRIRPFRSRPKRA